MSIEKLINLFKFADKIVSVMSDNGASGDVEFEIFPSDVFIQRPIRHDPNNEILAFFFKYQGGEMSIKFTEESLMTAEIVGENGQLIRMYDTEGDLFNFTVYRRPDELYEVNILKYLS